jgi:curved DNA-binding protein CbpA
MIDSHKPNPFQVLGLSTSATNKEIVERGRERYDTAETDEQRQLYRWAKEQLLSNPQTRLLYELFEAPGTRYEHPALENFLRKYRKNPVSAESLTRDASPISIKDFNIDELIKLLLQDMLMVSQEETAAVTQQAPFRSTTKLPLEVRDVLFG